jgi:hypothetical protein
VWISDTCDSQRHGTRTLDSSSECHLRNHRLAGCTESRGKLVGSQRRSYGFARLHLENLPACSGLGRCTRKAPRVSQDSCTASSDLHNAIACSRSLRICRARRWRTYLRLGLVAVLLIIDRTQESGPPRRKIARTSQRTSPYGSYYF